MKYADIREILGAMEDVLRRMDKYIKNKILNQSSEEVNIVQDLEEWRTKMLFALIRAEETYREKSNKYFRNVIFEEEEAYRKKHGDTPLDLNCPFCEDGGDVDLDIVYGEMEPPHLFLLSCRYCGASGPSEYSAEEAIKRWMYAKPRKVE